MGPAGRWAEEGTGDLKVLVHPSGRTRLVMRKDRSLVILLNQLVQPDAALLPAASEDGSGDRAFVFEAEDFATGACVWGAGVRGEVHLSASAACAR